MGSNALLLVISIFFIISSVSATAQLVGCDQIGCPFGETNYNCTIGNTTTSVLGITSFKSAIANQPLTWTLGFTEDAGPNGTTIPDNGTVVPANDVVISKDFWIGTPPTLNLSGSNPFEGCALLFEGISTSLQFPSPSGRTRTSVGTCSDALNSQCVNDLLSQAGEELPKLMSTTQNVTSLCTALQTTLSSNAPTTCSAPKNGSWGVVLARDLTGPNAALPAQGGNCRPTTGDGYNLPLVATYNRIVLDDDNELYPVSYGVTPIMTIFYSNSSGNAPEGSLKQPDLQLTCVKIVDNEGGPNVKLSSSSHAPIPIAIAALVAVAVFMAY